MQKTINQRFGSRIREVRVASGMKQTDLAQRLHISYQQVQKYETGKDNVSIEKLYAIAGALGCAPQSLLHKPETTGTTRSDLSLIKHLKCMPEKQRDAFLALAAKAAEVACA